MRPLITSYFKPSQQPPRKPVATIPAVDPPGRAPDKAQVPERASAQNVSSRATPSTGPATPDHVSKLSASQQLCIRSSDDEDSSDSESSLEDLADLFQVQNSTVRPSLERQSQTPRLRTKGKKISQLNFSPAKPKYKYDLKTLIKQAELDEAAETSALRVKALLDNSAISPSGSQSSTPQAAADDILESVIAGKEGTSMGKVLQAVKRTEATHIEKRWYFFEAIDKDHPVPSSRPVIETTEDWQAGLTNPQMREQLLLSGFARDMISLGGTLPSGFFEWMLYEMCLESRDDLRRAYNSVLLASAEVPPSPVHSDAIRTLFYLLGAKEPAIDIGQSLKLVSADASRYGGRDWRILTDTIRLLGQLAGSLSEETLQYIFCVIARLCFDSMVLENIGVLAAVQKTMEQISQSVGPASWETMCPAVCASIFTAIGEATLRFQVLRCIPRTNPLVHGFRRRLALAFFCNNADYASKPPQEMIDLVEITKCLEEPRFQIHKDTDYHQLAASMSILDVAIDNGISTEDELSNPEDERRFNAEVDALEARIKAIWMSINDSGASFISRIDAKEVMNGMQQRLTYSVRTKPKVKQGIFHSVPDDGEVIEKQAAMMKRFFGQGDAHNG